MPIQDHFFKLQNMYLSGLIDQELYGFVQIEVTSEKD